MPITEAPFGCRHTETGNTVRATLRKLIPHASEQVEYLVPGTLAFEFLTVANWSTYLIEMSEKPSASYWYSGLVPQPLDAGWYVIEIYSGVTITSRLIEAQVGYWSGGAWNTKVENVVQINGTDATDAIGTAAAAAILVTPANKLATGAAGVATATLTATGLDAITATAPTGVASTFPQMVVQTWRRFFKKAIKDTTTNTIKTYADNGTTVVTTQTIAETATTETQGAAT